MFEALIQKTKEDSRCTVARWADELDNSDREVFESLLTNHKIPTVGIFRAARTEGNASWNETALGQHRKGICSCSKV